MFDSLCQNLQETEKIQNDRAYFSQIPTFLLLKN